MAAFVVLLATLVAGSLGQTVYWPKCGGTEKEALSWTAEYNTKSQEVWPVAIEASWTYNTNITTANQAAMVSKLLNGLGVHNGQEYIQYLK